MITITEDGKIFKYREAEEISAEQVEQEAQNTRNQLVNDIEQAKARQEADQAIIDNAEKELEGLENTLKKVKKIAFGKGEVSSDIAVDLEANEKGK